MSGESATDFYDALAPMFDVMTDWDARLAVEAPFLQAVLPKEGARRVLDAACGSGGHALALGRWGYEAVGADISPAMVRIARGKAVASGQDVPFFVAGLADLPGQFTANTFDVVLCLGNTLPHLLTQQALVAALAGMAHTLRAGGLLVLQQLNYDLRWKRQPRFFAAQGGILDGQEVLIWRFADYNVPARQIAFNIALFRKVASGWDVQVHSTPQRPLLHAELLDALRSTGFTEIRSFARLGWPSPPFEVNASADLVVVSIKAAK